MAEKTMKVTVVRYRPEQDDKPWEQTFEVPYIKETSVLEALFYVGPAVWPFAVPAV